MTTFLHNLQRNTNLTSTENGAVTNASSLDPVVDFFGLAGAMRETPDKAADLFEKAYRFEPLTAVRTLFYLRDIRGGQGERDVFRASFTRLGDIGPGDALKLLPLIPEYGRWDDLLHIGAMGDAADAIRVQLASDLRSDKPSLLAKWLPSENATSAKTKSLARQLRTKLDMTPREYRTTLSTLRARIRLLEQDMSRSNWDGIDYGKLPGQAHRRHVKAFKRHTPDRYQSYLDSVVKGEAKINVSNVYPHEIYDMVQKNQQDYANVAWENLPDYTQGKNALVMADVSWSMVRPYQSANPIAVSVSLALYFAERNQGAFKDYFMTFSSVPQLVKIRGSNLAERMANISRAKWEMSTNLSAAFRTILGAAKEDPENAPAVLYVISDMEFDACTRNGVVVGQTLGRDPWGNRAYVDVIQSVPADTVFETAKREFAEAGLTLPHVCFWNVNARQTQAPALANDGNVTLVSGLSPTTFAQAVEGKSPGELVDQVVNGPRYEGITL